MTVLLGWAMEFALVAHATQTYGRKPYHVHLMDVVQVLRRFHDWDELSQDLVDAGWLHDTLEDTETTLEMLRSFSPRTIELVQAVTNEKGPNRKVRALATYPKIRATSGAIVLKLADRIANIEQSTSHDRVGRRPGKRFEMYSKEWPTFYSELKGRCRGEGAVASLMWQHLHQLIVRGTESLQEHDLPFGSVAFDSGGVQLGRPGRPKLPPYALG